MTGIARQNPNLPAPEAGAGTTDPEGLSELHKLSGGAPRNLQQIKTFRSRFARKCILPSITFPKTKIVRSPFARKCIQGG